MLNEGYLRLSGLYRAFLEGLIQTHTSLDIGFRG